MMMMRFNSKLKLLCLLLLGSGVVQAALVTKDNEEFHPSSLDLSPSTSRDLNQVKVKNENCNLTGMISCRVMNADKTDCRNLNIQEDKCEVLPVMMNYTFCNNERDLDDQIIIITSLSYTNLYEEDKRPLGFAAVPPGTCMSQMKRGQVDTCKRKRVNADMKLEGWKTFRRNYGNYCHVYKHYFPKINKFLPPSFEVITLCYVESTKGSYDFVIPCDEIDLEYFKDSFQGQSVKDEKDGQPLSQSSSDIDFKRNVRYEFLVKSDSDEVILPKEIAVTIGGETIMVDVPEDSIKIPQGGEVSIGELIKNVDFAEFSGETFEVSGEVTVVGEQSGASNSSSGLNSFQVPVIEFKWRLDNVICIIKNTNQPCEDYLAQLPTTDDKDFCEIDVEYLYEVENIGQKCELITDIDASVDSKEVTIQTFRWNFCPGDIVPVLDARTDDLCVYAEREIDFVLGLNGQAGFPSASFLTFPKPAGIGPILSILDFRCTIHNSSPKRTCADYIKFSRQENLPCVADVVYRSKVENIGDNCLFLNKLQLGVGTDLYNIPSKNWIDTKKNFCATEVLNLQKKVAEVNICDMANQEIDVMVIANQIFGDVGSIQFPKANSVTAAPVSISNAPSVAPVVTPPSPTPPTPPTPPTACSSRPNSITFKLNRKFCKDSSNAQGINRKRRLKRNKGKGSRKKLHDCKCEQCIDHNMNIDECPGSPLVTISSKNENDGSTVELYKGTIDFSTDFVFTPSTMPDCLQIDLHEEEGKFTRHTQVVGFDVTCSANHPLRIGDTFGAVEIVSIN